jgi:glycerol-3-phosphate dehydrogenase
LALARTAAARGALLVNYCAAVDLIYRQGKVAGLSCRDQLTGAAYTVSAGCVVNAAGVWVDELRQRDGVATGAHATPAMVAPSQGVHLVVAREFLDSDVALMVPKTADGRVLFAVPWLGRVILGTTDTPRADLPREPLPLPQEIDFILGESARYLVRAPRRADVTSVWVGLRPLVKPPADASGGTKALSREHTVLVSHSGLVTVTGGKWTTYRAMAEDVLLTCADAGLIPRRAAGVTARLRLVGAQTGDPSAHSIVASPGLQCYGDEAGQLLAMPGADIALGSGVTEAMVRFAARYEYAITVEDVLARRARLLFLDAARAAGLAHRVGEILQQETGLDPQIAEFIRLTQQYMCSAE